MLKRLIEVALPLKEVSEQSAREKSIRHGHISTLHIWWARRPLAACRAVVFASLIPDPDAPECPDGFRNLVMEVLKRDEFKPKRLGPSPASPTGEESVPLEDTPRNRCLEFIKHLVRWENSNNPDYIDPARKLIAAAHKFLHPDSETDAPKVLDPFAGGGAIPLEALRLGCEAHAIDLNPVAHLIELCTLVYPQKYGQPDSRPVPDYIKRLIAHNRAKMKGKDVTPLFDKDEGTAVEAQDGEIIPHVEITEAEYRRNPLATDVKYWGNWVLIVAKTTLGHLYPIEPDGSKQMAYLWAKTVQCPNPTCRKEIPLLQRMWLHRKGKHIAALKPVIANQTLEFTVVTGSAVDAEVAAAGTMMRGNAQCPICEQTARVEYLRSEACAGRLGERLLCVVIASQGGGRKFRPATSSDAAAFAEAAAVIAQSTGGDLDSPSESLPPIGTLGFRISRYGIVEWRQFFNSRQLAASLTFVRAIREASNALSKSNDPDYAKAITSLLAIVLDRTLVRLTNQCVWDHTTVSTMQVFNQGQALPMRWDYVETNPLISDGSNWANSIGYVSKVLVESAQASRNSADVRRGSATALPFSDELFTAVVTDPPYYDAVPYADLSDFFYVWQKRILSTMHEDVYRTPLTPKAKELIAYGPKGRNGEKTPEWYEDGMRQAFSEIRRILTNSGVVGVMFAHKTTAAWETLIRALLQSGLNVTASWPIRTESTNRLRAADSAALAGSVLLMCRRRGGDSPNGFWDDVRQELRAYPNTEHMAMRPRNAD